jgi:hypothetical protein
MLDSDSGATLDEIVVAIRAQGWAAAISSTHSHLNATTRVKRGSYEAWVAKNELQDDPAAGEAYLIDGKGMLPRVAAGTTVNEQDETYVTFSHQPCPRFRIILPLARSWVAVAYESQKQATKGMGAAVRRSRPCPAPAARLILLGRLTSLLPPSPGRRWSSRREKDPRWRMARHLRAHGAGTGGCCLA